MTGRRPDSLRVYNFVDHFRSTTPGAVALPEFFKGPTAVRKAKVHVLYHYEDAIQTGLCKWMLSAQATAT